MMFKNSIRLFLANFGIFWKDFLYKALVMAIVFLMAVPALPAVFRIAIEPIVATKLEKFLLMFPFSDFETYVNAGINLFFWIWQFLSEMFLNHLWQSVYLTVLFAFVWPFLNGLSTLAVSEMFYGHMATNTKYNFAASFVKKIWPSIKFSFFNVFVKIFKLALVLGASYIVLYLGSQNLVSNVFTPFLLVFGLVLPVAFVSTVFSGWAPSIIVFSSGVSFGFGKGLLAVGRRFFKTFSSLVMMLLIFVMTVSMFGLMSLAFLLPMLVVLLNGFSMIMFFGSQGMRYYVDTDTILSPKRLEETDKFDNAKDVI